MVDGNRVPSILLIIKQNIWKKKFEYLNHCNNRLFYSITHTQRQVPFSCCCCLLVSGEFDADDLMVCICGEKQKKKKKITVCSYHLVIRILWVLLLLFCIATNHSKF